MSEKDGQESEGERHAGEKSGGILVEKSEGGDEFVERSGLIVGVGDGELSTGSEASAKGEEKEGDGEDEGFEGRAGKNRNVGFGDGRESAPINGGGKRVCTGI